MKTFVENTLHCTWVPDINISPTYANSYDAVIKYTPCTESLKKILSENGNRHLIIGEASSSISTGECKAARNLCFIDSQGYIYPCLSFKIAEDETMRKSLETIAHRSFEEIWRTNPFLLAADMVSKDKFVKCLACNLYSSCHKCIAENYLASHNFYIPPKTYCQRQHILCEIM